MRKERFLSDVLRLAAKALANGGERVGNTRVRWDISGSCSNGYTMLHYARPSKPRSGGAFVVVTPETLRPMEVEMITPCRECESCRRSRAALWRRRIATEAATWPRTWFGTLTLRPDEHFRVLTSARARETAQGVDFDALSDREQKTILDGIMWRDIKLALMRIRSAYGSPFRYVCVSEAHKSGFAHYHLLVHQVVAQPPLKYRDLAGQWKLGFTVWRLVHGMEGPMYIAKYLSKSDALARVRASQHYGSPLGIEKELNVITGFLDQGEETATSQNQSSGGKGGGATPPRSSP